jgi:gas vesicle protein
MSDETNDIGTFLAGFVIGGLVGAAVALLLAPQSGLETRTMIRDRGIELKDKAVVAGQDVRTRADMAVSDIKTRADTAVTDIKTRADSAVSEVRARAGKKPPEAPTGGEAAPEAPAS